MGLNLLATFSELSSLTLLSMTLEKSGHSLLKKLEVVHDNSCSCEAFMVSWTQLKAERPRLWTSVAQISAKSLFQAK